MVSAVKDEALPTTLEPNVSQMNIAQPSGVQGDNAQSSTTQTSIVSTDTITVTVTLPRFVIDSGQEVNITVTPKSQRVAEPRTNMRETLTPPNSPRHRVPRFNLPGLATVTNNHSEVGDDPFIDNFTHDGSRGSLHVREGGRDIRSDSDSATGVTHAASDDDSPMPVYPLPRGRDNATQHINQPRRNGMRYYVITKGRKLGVFYDSWNRIQPLALLGQGGVCTKQDSFTEAKRIWDLTKSNDKQVLD
ncbi:hypothetical protein PILCRDRAFT_7139 [Piloderma croceum F 1598]|uniref:Uncharacterized protein n=1 Tax=Piloderma croceum (strain F 1598) TaxID=765440 RepID=A0A0C3FY84_PILCF|nr:hypothetical protein PILCRDRAFT_7139 [Piloderma croceum F 1598]